MMFLIVMLNSVMFLIQCNIMVAVNFSKFGKYLKLPYYILCNSKFSWYKIFKWLYNHQENCLYVVVSVNVFSTRHAVSLE